ncbi:hypothetical protein [Tepidibacter mesophilus]|uniref:hypothetical protein n=1 Tax=Tepidibacter mesophilus TaxID=655607 RepID=UPI000C08798D|nr:hypothetical protein [Tepidibacter mesophilus]
MSNIATGRFKFNTIIRKGENATVSIPLPQSDFKAGSLSFKQNDVFVFGTNQKQAYSIFKSKTTNSMIVKHRAMRSELATSSEDEGANIYGAYLALNNIWIEGNYIKLEFEHDYADYSKDYEDLRCDMGWEVHK